MKDRSNDLRLFNTGIIDQRFTAGQMSHITCLAQKNNFEFYPAPLLDHGDEVIDVKSLSKVAKHEARWEEQRRPRGAWPLRPEHAGEHEEQKKVISFGYCLFECKIIAHPTDV